ncbi:MAG: J domain-containing protein [Chloroflexota bacterium]
MFQTTDKRTSSRELTHYQVLQVDAQADQTVIDAAYRRLARSYHPDYNDSAEALSMMQQLNSAYSVLRDPVKRYQYDAQLKVQNSRNERTLRYRVRSSSRLWLALPSCLALALFVFVLFINPSTRLGAYSSNIAATATSVAIWMDRAVMMTVTSMPEGTSQELSSVNMQQNLTNFFLPRENVAISSDDSPPMTLVPLQAYTSTRMPTPIPPEIPTSTGGTERSIASAPTTVTARSGLAANRQETQQQVIKSTTPTATPALGSTPLSMVATMGTETATSAPRRLTQTPAAGSMPPPTGISTKILTETLTRAPLETTTNIPTKAAVATSTSTSISAAAETETETPEPLTTTPTDSPTVAPTWTPTQIPTDTPTETSTAESTSTATGTATETPEPPTTTPTDIPTVDPTWTPTQIPTGTPIETSTAEPTSTATGTATETPEPPTTTPTDIPTVDPTWTPTQIPTGTPTETSTTEPTSTATGTATETPEPPTATPTETATSMPTSTATLMPTATFLPTSTATSQPTGTSTGTVRELALNTPTKTATFLPTSTANALSIGEETQTETEAEIATEESIEPTESSTPTSPETPKTLSKLTKTDIPTATEVAPASPEPLIVAESFVGLADIDAELYDKLTGTPVAGLYSGTQVFVVAKTNDNQWYQLNDGYWVKAKAIKRSEDNSDDANPTLSTLITFPATAVALTDTNLFDSIGDDRQAVAGVFAGTALKIVDISEDGIWYQLEDGFWIAADVTEVE